MRQYLLTILFILSLSSCLNSTKTNAIVVKTQAPDTTFVPDRFENRDDTASFNIDKGKLSKKILTLDVLFGAISCTCAQWSETKYSKTIKNSNEFFLEPANTSLVNADTLFNGTNFPIRLSLTGQFYSKEGFPKNYRPTKGSPYPARVFRYTKIKILSTGKSLHNGI